MKYPLIIIFLYLLVNNSALAADFQTFADKSGRVVEAKIIAYSATSRKVTMQLRTGKQVSVPASSFDKTSQKLIDDWNLNKLHKRGKLVNVEFKYNELRSWATKKNITVMVPGPNGGSSPDSSQVKVKHELFLYNIKLNNLSASPLKLTNTVSTIYFKKRLNSRKSIFKHYERSYSPFELKSNSSARLATDHVTVINGHGHQKIEVAGICIKGEICTSSGLTMPFAFSEPSNFKDKFKPGDTQAYVQPPD